MAGIHCWVTKDPKQAKNNSKMQVGNSCTAVQDPAARGACSTVRVGDGAERITQTLQDSGAGFQHSPAARGDGEDFITCRLPGRNHPRRPLGLQLPVTHSTRGCRAAMQPPAQSLQSEPAPG